MIERWWIDGQRRDALERVAPLRVAAWIEAAEQHPVLSSDRQSVVVRIPGDPPLLVKWRHTIKRRRRKTWTRPSRERREARSALHARALGIPGPGPWAVGEVRSRGTVVASVLIRRFEDRAQRADEVVAMDDTAAPQLAQQVHQWHRAGWRHGDCYPKNVLLLPDRKTFAPIGYPSARFARRHRIDAACIKDLAQLSVGTALAPDTLWQAYGADVAAPVRSRLAKRVATIRERKQVREQTRSAREPNGPPKPERFTVRPKRLVVEDLLVLVD